MFRPPGVARRRAEGGFTFTETIVVIAVITAMASAAMVFFLGRYELARQHVVVIQLAEAIRTVQSLPNGNPLTWYVAAQKVLNDVMDVAPAVALPLLGTDADRLPNGLNVDRTRYDGLAVMRDRNSVIPTIAGCKVDDIQFTIYPASLPADSVLREVDAEWLKVKLVIGVPEMMVTVQEQALFCCLPPGS